MSKILYILKLEQDKYYVGITDNFEKRLNEHKNGTGSVWTKLYKYINTFENKEVSNELAEYEETKLTCKLMLDFGVNNVRGAQFCQIEPFFKEDIEHLVSTIGHNLKMKYEDVRLKIIQMIEFKENNNEYEEFSEFSECSDEEFSECSDEEYEEYNYGTCFRCGRNNHYANSCYAKTNVYGQLLTTLK